MGTGCLFLPWLNVYTVKIADISPHSCELHIMCPNSMFVLFT